VCEIECVTTLNHIDVNFGPCKIGQTAIKVQNRIKQFSTGNWRELGYVLILENCHPSKEQEIHDKFAEERIRSDREWFRLSDRLIKYINWMQFKTINGLKISDFHPCYHEHLTECMEIETIKRMWEVPTYVENSVLDDFPDFKKMIKKFHPNNYKTMLITGESCKRENCPYGGWNLDLECCGLAYDVDKRKEILCMHPSEVIGVRDEETI
jgi:hypothetical protein